MNICMINGSPKIGDKNNSSILLSFLKSKFDSTITVYELNIKQKSITTEDMQKICEADVIILAFPLYFDSVPSHLLNVMVALEEYYKLHSGNHRIFVYPIINNGFYEGYQCEVALEIVRNWCNRVGVQYGQGIGCGAGEMLPFIENIPLGHGPLKNIGRAIDEIHNTIMNNEIGENIYVNPNFPYFMWKFMATNAFWKPKAKSNGLTKNDLLRMITHEE